MAEKQYSEFYLKMLEAKKRKKEALERKQLHAEFEIHPERFKEELPPIIVKTDAEVKIDAAFSELQAKLRATQQSHTDKLTQAFEDLARKAQGL